MQMVKNIFRGKYCL